MHQDAHAQIWLTIALLQCVLRPHGALLSLEYVVVQKMAAVGKSNFEDVRRNALSPKLKGRGTHIPLRYLGVASIRRNVAWQIDTTESG